MSNEIFNRIRGRLIVSCQALEDEPLHSSYIMSKMAYAAYQGGASGIRANSVEDIKAIKEVVDLPVIGIIKIDYPDSEVYITPTMKEVDELVECNTDIIAMDATKRIRPNGQTIQEFFKQVRAKYPNQLFMADCSTYEEGMEASRLGFDIIGTTMHGYTSYTKGVELPNFTLIKTLVENCGKEVIAEGGIWTPQECKQALDLNVLACVVGTAITRPREITKKFVDVISRR